MSTWYPKNSHMPRWCLWSGSGRTTRRPCACCQDLRPPSRSFAALPTFLFSYDSRCATRGRLDPITCQSRCREHQQEFIVALHGLLNAGPYLIPAFHVFLGVPATHPLILQVSREVLYKRLALARITDETVLTKRRGCKKREREIPPVKRHETPSRDPLSDISGRPPQIRCWEADSGVPRRRGPTSPPAGASCSECVRRQRRRCRAGGVRGHH